MMPEIYCHGCGETVWTDGEHSTVTCRHDYDIDGVDLPLLEHNSQMEFCSQECVTEWALDTLAGIVDDDDLERLNETDVPSMREIVQGDSR